MSHVNITNSVFQIYFKVAERLGFCNRVSKEDSISHELAKSYGVTWLIRMWWIIQYVRVFVYEWCMHARFSLQDSLTKPLNQTRTRSLLLCATNHPQMTTHQICLLHIHTLSLSFTFFSSFSRRLSLSPSLPLSLTHTRIWVMHASKIQVTRWSKKNTQSVTNSMSLDLWHYSSMCDMTH